MKKNLIASLLVIAIAVSAIAGGTLAWFTDTDAIPQNKFVAGVLSMDVDDVFDYEDNTYDDFTPGDDIDKLVQITNDGTKREFLRALITEVRTQKLHFEGTELVEYLHGLDVNNESTQTPGVFAATMVAGQWIVPYDAEGYPIEFGTAGYTAGDGFTGIYVTNLGGYDAAATGWNGINGDTSPTYVAVRKLANTSDPLSALVPIPGSSIDVYRELPSAQWRVTTTQNRDLADIQWYIQGATPFDGGLWEQVGTDPHWYFNQALYPQGYDTTPADGNDNAAFTATVAPFLDSVEFVPSANDNAYQGSTYTIDVTFETIQVTNGAALAAWGVNFSADLTTNLAANVTGTWA